MSKRGPIDRERFAQLLDAYGAEPARWPDDERAGAQALLAGDTEAQRMHAQALELDGLLDGAVALEPSAALRRAVAEIPLRAAPSAAVQLPWLFASALRSALAAAFVLGLGVLAGSTASADALLADTSEAGAVGANVDGTGTSPTAVGADDGLDTLLELAFSSAPSTVDDEQETP